MMQKKKLKVFQLSLLVVILIFNTKCANIGAPNGGPKDTLYPKIRSIVPSNKSVDYKGEYIYITLSEWVKTDRLKEELEITPSFEKSNLEVSSYKNTIKIKFLKPLDENTTYTFNFNKGITDVNENNPLKENSLVFSTGKTIDSLSIKGEVVVNESQKPMNKCFVGLYKYSDTINIKKQKPYISTFTDNTGKFKFSNLKNGVYEIYSFNDISKNQLLNESDEIVGFVKEPIKLNTNKDSLKLRLVLQNYEPLKYVSQFTENNKLVTLTFNKNIADFKNNNKEILSIVNGKKVDIYALQNLKEGLALEYNVKDSLNIDTSGVITLKYAAKEYKEKTCTNCIKRTSPNEANLQKNVNEVEIEFNVPIKEFNYDSIYIYNDTSKVKVAIPKINFSTTNNNTKLKINTSFVNATDGFKVALKKKYALSILNDTLETKIIRYNYLKEENSGNIYFTTKTEVKNYIIEVLNSKNEIVYKNSNGSKHSLEKLLPDTYKIRALIDENKNGLYDIGNYKNKIEPEKYIYYEKETVLKENWEITDIKFQF